MRRVLFIALMLWLVPVVGNCQVSLVTAEYGDQYPARGSWAVIHGRGFTSYTETMIDPTDLPESLAGLTVDINGHACGIRYASPEKIIIAIPDHVPFTPPGRFRPNILTVRSAAGYLYRYRLFINDSAPWFLPYGTNGQPIVVTYSADLGFRQVTDGAIQTSATQTTRVTLWATGARSFWPLDWLSYHVYLILPDDNMIDLPAWVSASPLIQGVDYVTFDIHPEHANLGPVRVQLKTPSNASNVIKLTISAHR